MKKFKFQRLIILSLVIITMQSLALAETVIEKAQGVRIVTQNYNKEMVRGKDIVQINYWENMAIDVFVAPDGVTEINLPYVIIGAPVISASDIFKITAVAGTKFCIITLKQGPSAIGLKDIPCIIMAQNSLKKDEYFKVLLKLHVVPKNESNSRIILKDGEAEQFKTDKNLSSIVAQNASLTQQLDEQELIINNYNFFPVRRYELNDEVEYNGVTLKLMNISTCQGKYYYNFIIDYAGKEYDFLPTSFVLETNNFHKDFFSETKSKTKIHKAEKIKKWNNGETNFLTVVFSDNEIDPGHYYSYLEVGKKDFKFDNKLDVEETALKGDLFDVSY